MKHLPISSPKCQVILALAAGLFLSGCSLSMEYNRAKQIREVDLAYSSGQITKNERDKKVAALQKAYAEYEARWNAQIYGQPQNQVAAGVDQFKYSSAPQVYTYQSQPQYVYVQGPAHRPGGGYTPQPQQVYVQGPAHNPGGGYTPQPQQVYTQGPAHNPGGGYTPQPQQVYTQGPAHNPGGGYTPQSQQAYVQNPQRTPGGGYTPEKAPQYVNNDRRSVSTAPSNEQAPEMRYKTVSEMNTKERREYEAQKLKPGTISNPGPEIAKRQGEKYDAAVKQIPWYLKWQYMFAKGATEDAFPLIKGAEKVNQMRDAQKSR